MDMHMRLENYLTGLLNRRVTVDEAAELVGLKRAQYTKRRDSDTLTSDQIAGALDALGLSQVEVYRGLITMGYIDPEVMTEALEGRAPGFSAVTTERPRTNRQRSSDLKKPNGEFRF